MLLQFPKKLELLEDLKRREDFDLTLPTPYSDVQRMMMNGDFRTCIAILGTKVGKTLSATVRTASKSYQAPEDISARFRLLAPVYQQSKLSYDYMRRLFPEKIPYDIYKSEEENEYIQYVWEQNRPLFKDKQIYWRHNNASIFTVTGDDPATIEGDRMHGVVIDEMAKVKEASIAASLSTTTQTGGWHLMITTPTKGKNHAYKYYKENEERMNHDLKMGRTPEHYAFRVPSWASPYSDIKQIDNARKTMPKRLFDMLYGAEFVDGSGVFNNVNAAFGDATEFEHSDYFLKQTHESKVVFIGVDFAKKVDYTVFYAINEQGKTVGWWRMQGVSYAEQVARIWKFCEKIKERSLLLGCEFEILYDETGVGGAVKEVIDMTMKYPTKGIIWNNANKCEGVYKTIAAFEQRELDLIPWATLKNELEFFEAKETGTGRETFAAADGSHDDCVMSLIMCVMMLQEHRDNTQQSALILDSYQEQLKIIMQMDDDFD